MKQQRFPSFENQKKQLFSFHKILLVSYKMVKDSGNEESKFATDMLYVIDSQTKKVNYISMPMYNLIEYCGNYSDTSGSLQQFKRDEIPANNAYLTIDNSKSFKDKATLF